VTRFAGVRAFGVTVLVLLALPVRSPANDQRATGRKGAVVSASRYASRIGVSVLKNGGNAIDAAVATFFALAVTHPQAGNIGGGGFLIVHLADGTNIAFDFREMAPRRARRDMYLDEQGRVRPGVSLYTALAVGVPGSVAGICSVHARFGKRPLAELIRPAIELAEKGFVVDSFLQSSIAGKRNVFRKWPSTATIFLRDGKPLHAGARLVQKDLAATLTRIAEHGPDGFYKGKTAELIAAEMKRSRGLIDEKDLAAYVVKEREPLRGNYRGYTILSMPPPSSGGVALLQMLNMLEPHDIAALGLGSSKTLHLMIEVMKRAYADRARWLGDPDFYPVPVEGLVAKDYAKKITGNLSMTKATPEVAAGSPEGAILRESRETTHLSVLDSGGNAVSCTTTLNSSFGNGQVVTGAGFFLNNEMDDFSAKPGVPNQFGLVGAKANEIQPGKRMLSSMTPTIVLAKDGKRPFLILGSPGGGRIINTVLQVTVNVVDFRLPLATAVAAPRIHEQWLPKPVYWERLALPADVRDALVAMGHTFQDRPRIIGRCQAILWHAGGRIDAVSDPRSPGTAVAW